jgi:CBS-domain-containing membrane protein
VTARPESSPLGGVCAGDVMTTPVITVAPDATLRAVADLLTHHRIGSAPVVDGEGVVVGLVSEYDLLARSGTTVADVMTTAVVTVSEDTAIEDVRHLLVDRRLRHLPVLSGGRLVGIVSRGDVVALMATEWVCRVCGEPVRGERPPQQCPKCGAAAQFELQEQPPGA